MANSETAGIMRLLAGQACLWLQENVSSKAANHFTDFVNEVVAVSESREPPQGNGDAK